MELQFEKNVCSCLNTALREVQNQEQTQELKLPEGMPDIGRVLTCWAQPILRAKEWRTDSISVSGGMMVWVLYAPEDGSEARCMEGWIPFQMRWELPEHTPEGQIRIRMLPRYVDGRSVSARKLMVRSGIGVMAEALVPMETELSKPTEVPEDVQLLRQTYPIRLTKEAGEKAFAIEEDLTLPSSCPIPERLVYYALSPQITDQKVSSDKAIFKGKGNLHMLYRSEAGQLHSWDFELPFAQYAQLEHSYGTDAQLDVAVVPSNLEVELDEEGHIRMKCGMVGQYLVNDREMLELTQDAYSPSREVAADTASAEVPAVLENRTENIYGEQTIPGDANLVADLRYLPDFPRQRRTEQGVSLELPGTFQALYYDENGVLQSGSARWEGQYSMDANEDSQITAVPMYGGEPQASIGSGSISVRSEMPVQTTAISRRGLPMITGLTLGEQQDPDPGRPSLILRRAGDGGLWKLARDSGSTVDAIRKANGLSGEPVPGQMLLIPVV